MTIYLDHNATTPLRSAVAEAMATHLYAVGNPSSVHAAGRAMRAQIEHARQSIAQSIGTHPKKVIFTSGATEANNLALCQKITPSDNDFMDVYASTVEHSSVLMVPTLKGTLSVDHHGVINLQELNDILSKRDQEGRPPCIISVMFANNETGTIQPIDAIAALCRKYKVFLHSDGAQALGKISLKIDDLQLDAISFSAHKVGGPTGIGALVHHPRFPVRPLVHGGGQEDYKRGGTENTLGIIGFGKLADLLPHDNWRPVEERRNMMENAIMDYCPEAKIFGGPNRLPNTSCIMMPGVTNDLQLMHFDLQYISISKGSACSSGRSKPSHVLQAMGVKDDEARCAIRVSLGLMTTDEDIYTFVKIWKHIHEKHAQH